MSSFYEKVKFLVESTDDEQHKELYDFYAQTAIEKLDNSKECTYMGLLLLKDLSEHLKKHPFTTFEIVKHTTDQTNEFAINFTFKHDDEFIANDDQLLIDHLKAHIINMKILQLRAIILDLIVTDYSSDSQQFYKPEEWIYEVIKNIEETFQTLLGFYIKELNEALLSEFKIIFLSSNKKLGYHGNLLIMNFVVYERWVKKHLSYDFDEFFDAFKANFIPERIMNIEEINNILDQVDEE